LSFENGNGADKRYFLYNGHGDTVQLTSTTGSSIKTYDYDAFGNEKNADPNDTNLFRYCGEYFDKETGTIYLRARYYDPTIGRFITEDSYWGKDSDPLSLNLYTYCFNNAVNLTDPLGNDPPKHIPKDATYNLIDWDKNGDDWFYVLLRINYGVGNDNNFASGIFQVLPYAVKVKIMDWCDDNNELRLSNRNEYDTQYANQILNFFDATKDYASVLDMLGNAIESKDYVGLGALLLVGGGITNRSDIELKNGMVLKTNVALDEANKFLGKGYKDLGGGRYISADGTRQVRLTDSDITTSNNHAGAPHFNFEILEPNPSKPGKMRIKSNMHIFIQD